MAKMEVKDLTAITDLYFEENYSNKNYSNPPSSILGHKFVSWLLIKFVHQTKRIEELEESLIASDKAHQTACNRWGEFEEQVKDWKEGKNCNCVIPSYDFEI